jgi:4-hydroxy-tetrahydrodipicolinate reductase
VSESGIPVVLIGLGEIGQAIGRAVLARDGLDLVAAVDPHPSVVGRPLAEVLGAPGPELRVEADLAKALAAAARGGVVLHATSSRFDDVLPELEAAVRAGLHVVSTCEELANPRLDHEEAAERLDQLCEENGVSVVGTGVNPGFVLDRLPALLAQATGEVRHVRGVRVVDVARRRGALQRKVGVGLSEDAFQSAYDRDEVGHVGLVHSAALVAESCIGVDEYEVDEEVVPLLAEEDAGGPVAVAKGQVAGLQQIARVFAEDREIVRLELTIAVGAEDPRDELELDADPPVRLVIRGGIAGDAATANAVVNAIPAVVERHGLLTVLDLPVGR